MSEIFKSNITNVIDKMVEILNSIDSNPKYNPTKIYVMESTCDEIHRISIEDNESACSYIITYRTYNKMITVIKECSKITHRYALPVYAYNRHGLVPLLKDVLMRIEDRMGIPLPTIWWDTISAIE